MFLFFGVVAVTGSYFVQVQELPWQAFGCAVPVGLLASAILVVNNVRDIDTDRRAGKRTLAVRLGRERTRALYTAMVAVAFVSAPLLWALGMSAWLLLSCGGDPARGEARADRAHAGGRAVAERRAGAGRARCSWSSACCSRRASSRAAGSEGEREAADGAERRAGTRCACASPLRERLRALERERELLAVALTDEDGVRRATAKRRRWSPMTA